MKKINFNKKKHILLWKSASKKKKTVITVIFMAGLGIASVSTFFLKSNAVSQMSIAETMVQEAQASVGNISNTIVGTGNLEIDDSISIKIPSGIIIDEVKVESGDHVFKGDVLAVVDEASVLNAMAAVQSEIDDLDEEMNESKDAADTETITAKVAGRVKKIYVQEGSDAAESMVSNGALMLLSLDGKMAVDLEGVSGVSMDESVSVTLSDGTVKEGIVESVNGKSCTVTLTDNGVAIDDAVNVSKTDGTSLGSGKAYIHEKLEITATGGSVSDIAVSENEKVYGNTTLLTLESNEKSTEYRKQAAQRQELAESLKKLIVLSQTGTITANADGTVGSINVTESSGSSQNAENVSSAESGIQAGYMSYTSASDSLVLLSTTSTGSEAKAQQTETQEETQVETLEENNVQIKLQIKENEKSTKNILGLTAPKIGNKPQTKITASDESYTGVMKWNPDDSIFAADIEYQADVILYASEGYVFGCDSILKIQTGLLSNVSVSEDGKTMSFHVTFSSTGTEQQENNSSKMEEKENPVSEGNAVSAGVTGTGSTTGGATTGNAAQCTETEVQETEEDYSTAEVTAFTLASDDNMILSVSVDELDINSISREQEAEVTLDAIEGASFTGTVTKVGNSASSSGNGTAKYTVEITIPRDEQMKAGMNASATIVIENKENVVTIPVNALQEKSGKSFVYTEKDSEENLSGEQEVTTGLSDGDKVEITEGLSAGDIVYYQKTGNISDKSSNNMRENGMPGDKGEMPGGGFPGGSGEMPSMAPGQGGKE